MINNINNVEMIIDTGGMWSKDAAEKRAFEGTFCNINVI